MEILENIPFAILGNIAFLALLFIIYSLLKHFVIFKPSIFFILGVCFQVLGVVQFILTTQFPLFSMQKISFYSFDTSNKMQILWFIGMVYCGLLIGYLLYLILQLNNLKTTMLQADYSSSQKFNHLIAPFIGHSTIQIGLINDIAGPRTFGWLKPIILLPFSIGNQLTTDEIKYLLLHEIAHIQRNDYLINIFIEFSHAILFFNPFSYYFKNEIQLEREKACDEWVVDKTAAPLLYSKALYKLARFTQPPIAAFNLNIFQNAKQLLERIQYLNNVVPPNSIKLLSIHLFSALLFMGLFFLVDTSEKKILTTYKPTVNTKQARTTHLQAPLIKPVLAKKNARVESVPLNHTWEIAQNRTPSEKIQDSSYQLLVQATMQWIKERSGEALYTNLEEGQETEAYSIAEKLLMSAILRKYELKKAILEHSLGSLQDRKEAVEKLKSSNEWKSILQYENWAKSFLKYHPITVDTSKTEFDF